MVERSVCACALLFSWSCSFVAGTSDERTPGPSAPVVIISPSLPRTLDDLHAQITVPSTDPEGEDIEYHFAWTLTGSDDVVSESSTLDDMHTSRGQAWTVTVTPEADGRFGTPTRAHVEIANTPPTIDYVGLKRYDVLRDEQVEVFFGPTTDPDGDPVTNQIAWRFNGTPTEHSSARVSLPSLSAVGGETIEVSVTPHDGLSAGPAVAAGPARVRSPGVQWRPLVPERRFGFPSSSNESVYDARHRRWLTFVRHTQPGFDTTTTVWEYALDARRWARLLPTGTDVSRFDSRVSECVVDDARHRVIFFGEIVGDAASPVVRIFDFTHRGGESWRALSASTSSAPMPLVSGWSSVVDSQRNRILVTGGVELSDAAPEPFTDGLWELALGDSEATWTRLVDHLSFGSLLAPVWVLDEAEDAAYLLGGGYTEGGSSFPVSEQLNHDVWRFDLVTNTMSSAPVAVHDELTLGLLPSAAANVGDGTVWLLRGVTSNDATLTGTPIYSFDLGTLRVTPVALSGEDDLFDDAHFTNPAYDERDRRVHVSPHPSSYTWFAKPRPSPSRVAISLDGSVEALERYGVSSPPALSRLQATLDKSGQVTLYFGRRATDEAGSGVALASPHVWSFTAANGFEHVLLDQQPTLGRFDYGFGTNHDKRHRYFIGGVTIVSGAPTVTYEVHEFSTRATPPWRFRGTIASNADFSRATLGPCGATTTDSYFVLGGAAAFAGLRQPISSLLTSPCVGATCSFAEVSSDLPVPNSAVTSVLMGTTLWTFGGEGHGDVLRYGDPCSAAPQVWQSVTLAALPDLMPHARAFALDESRFLVVGSWADGAASIPLDVAVVDVSTPGAPVFTPVVPMDGRSPPARFRFAADSDGGRVVVFGGEYARNGGDTHSDLWELVYDTAL